MRIERALMLAIVRIADGLAAAGEAVSVGIAGVELLDRGDREAGDLMGDTRLQLDEFDGCAERAEMNRKARVRLLAQQRLLQGRVAAVNADHIARYVCRGKEREPHDVVP